MTSPMPDIDLDAPDPNRSHLVGKQVLIILDHDDPDAPRVLGELLSIDVGGEAQVRRPDGQIGWCWPALEISEYSPLEGQEASG